MPRFISVDVVNAHENGVRPAKINADAIAYFHSSGNSYNPDGPTTVVFLGGGGAAAIGGSVVVRQTAAEVAALLSA